MTQEDKELLLKDLCGRLPYGVKVKYYSMEYPYGSKPVILTPYLLWDRWENINGMRPYLRPMSSMTEEERDEVKKHMKREQIVNVAFYHATEKTYDWYNAHHFDYRIDPSTGKTLIESNLAIVAPDDMYK